jgi:hypothetical protein
MKHLFRATIAMAGFAALLVVPSIALASPELTHPTGTNAPVGTKFLATNVEHATTSKSFKTTLPTGTMECSTATVTGEVVQNNGTHLVGTISTFELNGTAGNTSVSHCASPSGATTITPNHTTNPSHNGVASLPWCITFGKEDGFTIFGETGGSCTSGQTRAITIVYHSSLTGACTYQKAVISGTYTTHPADAILTIASQQFNRVTGSGFCPTSFSIDMALTLATDVNGVAGAPLYIS